MAFGLIKPEHPKKTQAKKMVKASTVEYGEYLANSVANCVGCHTEREMKSGAFIGKPFAGGMFFAEEPRSEGKSYYSPNLTPDPETGVMAHWTEETFIARFHAGYGFVSPMPWGSFSRIDDIDLKAIFLYLKSLEPVSSKVEKTVYHAGEPLP